MQLKKTELYYVNLYTCDRAYGGSEEGGWWFDTGEFERAHSFVFTDRVEARTRRDLLQARTDHIANNPRGSYANLGSVSCEGRLCWQIETRPGQDYPQDRPFYE